MTARVHGYNMTNRLGYLIGDNAFVSFATNAADVEVKATGVITPLQQFKELYAYDPTKDIAVNVTKTVDVNDFSGDPVTVSESNVPAELRTINGVVYADDASYIKAWAAQENVRRLVDTIQQRAVIMAMSAGAAVDQATVAPAVAGKPKFGEWSVAIAASATNQFITFMVEKATVFNRMRPNSYGQPEAEVIVGKELLDDLISLPLLNATASNVALTGTNYAVRIDNTVPRII